MEYNVLQAKQVKKLVTFLLFLSKKIQFFLIFCVLNHQARCVILFPKGTIWGNFANFIPKKRGEKLRKSVKKS